MLDRSSEAAANILSHSQIGKVEIYRPGGREPELLEGGSAVEGDGPVAGFVLELAKIFGVSRILVRSRLSL